MNCLVRTNTVNESLKGLQPIDEFREAIEQARKMTPAQRFFAGADLFDFACSITRAGIRSRNPGISEAEVLQLLRKYLEFARRLEYQQ